MIGITIPEITQASSGNTNAWGKRMTNVGAGAVSTGTFDRTQETTAPLGLRYEALLEILGSLGSSHFTQELFQSVALALRPIAKFRFLNLQIYDEDSSDYHRYSAEVIHGPSFSLPSGVPKEETGAWWVYKAQHPLAIPDVDREPRFRGVIEALLGIGIKSVYLFPLTTVHRRLGSIAFTCERREYLSHEEIRFLSAIANQLAMSLGNVLQSGRLPNHEDGTLPPTRLRVTGKSENKQTGVEEIVGRSARLAEVLDQVRQVAATTATVMIYGETGTGKELIARAIHKLSPRRAYPFLNLNCAAIPAGLFESELFGYEKGAFTGAIAQRAGRFELASQGSIFLDEVGEIPLDMQPKLLRVLQEKEFERLGSSQMRRTNVRLIAATNSDLSERVKLQTFRSDLYFRLNVFPIRIPSLRERREDIPLLAEHFVNRFSLRMGKKIDTIPSETMSMLMQYDWPGNIRELQNFLERAVILSRGNVLTVAYGELRNGSADFPLEKRRQAPARTENIRHVIEEVEREQILRALDETKWIISGPSGAAERIGMNRSTLQFRMRKLGIPSRRP
jgi:formate hydrogenlyase transcriptional activator